MQWRRSSSPWVFASGMVGLPFILGAGVLLLAEIPGRLDGDEWEKGRAPVVAIEVPDAPEKKTDAQEPEPKAELKDPLADLAPEPLSPDQAVQEAGFGAAFGQGGQGPALGSASGSLGGSDQVVRDAARFDRAARVLARAPLEYPAAAKARGVTGRVTLRLKVGPSGELEEIVLQESEPAGVFDDAAFKAVRAWRFEPALVAGQPQASWLSQRIRFDLN